MSGVDEFAKHLAASPAWQQLLERVAALEHQVAALRGGPAATSAARSIAECPVCGSEQFHRARSSTDPKSGGIIDHWVCGECEHEEDQRRDSAHR